MNRSNKLTTLLFAAGLSVFTIPALAQSSVPNPGTTTDPDHRTPPTPAAGSAISTDSRTGSASTDSSASGTSGADQNSTVYGPRGTFRGTRVDEPSGIGFDELDRDRDGRISLTEYTQSSAVDSASAPGGISGSPVSSNGLPDSEAGGSTGGRSGATTGVSGGNLGAERRADVFRQLDRNHDGYLARDELDATNRERK